MDLSILKALEREKILEVLQRDKALRALEEERVRKLKLDLQELRRRGTKGLSKQYNERTCARCQWPLGKFWNCGAVCYSCSHRICSKCRVCKPGKVWKCTVCYAYRNVKIKSGEWFLEERAKKYPADAERNESIGEQLLESYCRLSNINVVPPTPPPFNEGPSVGRPAVLVNSKPFTKSVENLFVSLTSHIKKISKSQNDVSSDPGLLTADWPQGPEERRRQSDTAINWSFSPTKALSLPDILREGHAGLTGSNEDTSSDTGYSGEKGSTGSLYAEYLPSTMVTGEIALCLVYSFRSSCLEIKVGACRNLAYGDQKRSKCHPYVKINLLPEGSPGHKLKTKVKKNTVNPLFNETFMYHIESLQLPNSSLHVSVWHSGILSRKVFLGEVLIPLEEWKFADTSPEGFTWYQLSCKSSGSEAATVKQNSAELSVRVNFTPSQHKRIQFQGEEIHIGQRDAGQLTILITGANNLGFSKPGTINSFVKGHLVAQHRELSQKTSVEKTKSSFQWKHKLVFQNVSMAELQDSCLELVVWEHASFGFMSRPLGGAKLEGALLWQQILQPPSEWHDVTLPVDTGIREKDD